MNIFASFSKLIVAAPRILWYSELMTSTPYEHLHAEATQHYALAHHHLTKLKEALDEMTFSHGGIPSPSMAPVRCVREWSDWLSVHGPTVKGDIQEATGIKFSERGTKYTVEWVPSLADAPDDRFSPNTLMKIGTKPNGRGAPPKIYFLWSQRFDVYPLFGVGPIKPDLVPGGVVSGSAAEAMGSVGLLMVPDEILPVDPPVGSGRWNDEVRELMGKPVRAVSMEEWDQAHAALFDALVSADAKPTDEQKQMLRDTLPEGADGNAALAIGYRKAVERSRQSTLLGVVHPPEEST